MSRGRGKRISQQAAQEIAEAFAGANVTVKGNVLTFGEPDPPPAPPKRTFRVTRSDIRKFADHVSVKAATAATGEPTHGTAAVAKNLEEQ
jgi:hypothetical protein